MTHIQLADRAIRLRDDLTEHLGTGSAQTYTNIELSYAMGARKRAPLKQGQDFRKPIGTHLVKAHRPNIQSKPGFRTLPDTIDRALCLAIYTELETESETGSALTPGWLLQSEICDRLGIPLSRRTQDHLGLHCEAMRVVGLVEGKRFGKKNLYRSGTQYDREFSRGQLVLSSLWGNYPRLGIVIDKADHDIYPIEILTVRWFGKTVELVGSDIALPIASWAETKAAQWLNLDPDLIRQARLQFWKRDKRDWRSLPDRDRILEVLRWRNSTISDLWAIVNDTNRMDNLLDRLEREHKILKSRLPNGFYQYSLA